MAQNPYYVDPGNDYSTGLSGLSNALSGVRQSRIQQAEQDRLNQAQQLKQDQYDRANQRFLEVQDAAQKAFASQDPDTIAQAAVQYPEIVPMLKQATGLKDDTQNREALDFTRAFATADDSARPALYENRIKSIMARGGDPTHTIQSYQDYQQNPQAETRDVLSYWAGIDPKGYGAYSNEQKQQQQASLAQQKIDQQYQLFNQAEAGRNQRAETRNALSRQNSGVDKATAHIKDFQQYQDLMKSDPVAGKAFGQAAGFVSKEGRELAPGVQTRLAKTVDAAVTADNNVAKYNDLADRLESSEVKGGVAGSVAETLKDLTGSQDAVTELRKEAFQARASQASANLPPGSASDADVKIAFGPMPSDRSNKAQWAQWLRAQAKVHQINSNFNNFKADYISDNGTERGMLQAWKAQGGAGGAAQQSQQRPAQQQQVPAVSTQAQFDALPSGAVYTEDGQQYRKP